MTQSRARSRTRRTLAGALAGVLVALVIYEAIRFREIRHRIRFDEH